ncbi:type II toxin-antitoxin system RelE/ParE family toxin [Methylobacterium sp. NI91]|nr:MULTISPECIES: type II toxin-antitoxin system RelE/ParE family toxin [unclassified Methylobacterium]QIJ74121.1 type II toxin-antitoxin system RelE/ParE family toxin [Methylobacterium sp. CLZ]QIJ79025.1 type II toxin-antitoxin system RelE/ParE family toxin [Methylobacterium sp. NI91]
MKVRLSAAARRDLSGIWTYSAKRWDEAQADRYVRLFADSFDGLASGMVTGRGADDIRPGYFKLAVGSHLVFYRMGAADVIEVVRILHQRMDFDRHL